MEKDPSAPKSPAATLKYMLEFAKRERLSGYQEAGQIAEMVLENEDTIRDLSDKLTELASQNPLVPRDQFMDTVRYHVQFLSLSPKQQKEIDNFAYGLMEAFGGSVGPNGFVDLSSLK